MTASHQKMRSDLIESAETDPAECIERCRILLDKQVDTPTTAAAHHAMGIALRSLGRVDESIASLGTAQNIYEGLGLEVEAAESMISKSASVAMAGDIERARSMLQPLSAASDSVVRAHAQVQLAGILARTGDFDEAIRLYGLAEPELDAAGDQRWLALLSSNRGLIYTYSGEFSLAEFDIGRAMDLFGALGRQSSVAEMLGNLGFMFVLKGDIAVGLRTLLDAQRSFRRSGLPTATVDTARAYGYMLAGLPERAAAVLRDTASALNQSGRALVLGEALILLARAALASGDLNEARRATSEALKLESMGEREGWRLQAELCRAEADLRSGKRLTTSIEPLARRLLEMGSNSHAVRAFALDALDALRGGDRKRAAKLLDESDTIATTHAELSARVQTSVVRAELSLAAGEGGSAMEALTAAADLVDRNRVLLSATESRAGLSRLTDEVASLGLKAIGHGPQVIDWLERFRGSSLRIAPVVANRNPQLAEALAELRRVTKALEESTLAGEPPSATTLEIRRLESNVRDLALAHPDRSVLGHPVDTRTVRSQLGQRQMLYLYELDDQLCGQILSSQGSRDQRIGETHRIRTLARHVLSGARRYFLNPTGVDSARPLRDLDELGRLLLGWGGLVAESVVVVPPADLLALPWNAMSARSIAADVVVAPSASAWYRADRSARRSGSTVVATGPDLYQAEDEASAVTRAYNGVVSVLSGEHALVEAVLEQIASSATFHGVAHGLLRRDNPMFSALKFADGDLNLFLLERIERAPSTVVLSACDSAHGSIVGGQEMYGLTSMFLNRGSRSILATVAPIPDSRASVSAVERLHRHLRDGESAASALGSAQRDVTGLDPSLMFVAYGAA